MGLFEFYAIVYIKLLACSYSMFSKIKAVAIGLEILKRRKVIEILWVKFDRK